GAGAHRAAAGGDHAGAPFLGRSQGRAGEGRRGPGAARPRPRLGARRGRRRDQQARGGGRPGRAARPAAAGGGAPRGRVGDGELQGEPAPRHAAGAGGHHQGGRLQGPRLHRPRRPHGGGHRREVQPAAGRERVRQLREGRAARAGEDRARQGPGPGPPAAARHVRGPDRADAVSGEPGPGASGERSVPHVNPWLVAVSVMFATFMEILDTTVVNVSLPHIAGSLSATIDESTWALTSYLVANAIILPLTGWLANYFGRKRLLMISVGGFTVASFLCGLAPNLEMLVVFRIIQGMTGGALQPLSQAVLLEAFPPEERGKAMGFWGLGIV